MKKHEMALSITSKLVKKGVAWTLIATHNIHNLDPLLQKTATSLLAVMNV